MSICFVDKQCLSTVDTAIIYLVRVSTITKTYLQPVQWLLQAKGQENLGKLPEIVMTGRGENTKNGSFNLFFVWQQFVHS